jgi:hypothetical protein
MAFASVTGVRCGIAAFLLFFLAACSGADQEGGDHRQAIVGSLTIEDSYSGFRFGEECRGRGGYDDIRAGAGVSLFDGAGSIIANGSLDAGEPGAEPLGTDFARHCTFEFYLSDVPRADFYRLEVGGREGPTYSLNELEASDWTVHLSLGS